MIWRPLTLAGIIYLSPSPSLSCLFIALPKKRFSSTRHKKTVDSLLNLPQRATTGFQMQLQQHMRLRSQIYLYVIQIQI